MYILAASPSFAGAPTDNSVSAILETQNESLEKNTIGKGFGPQSPRDLNVRNGLNKRFFAMAPTFQKMNLCNIHFHKNAEHKGGDFTSFAGYGDDQVGGSGYKYSGILSEAESRPLESGLCKSEYSELNVGDTIEVHYVFSTAEVSPGPTLNSCFGETAINPQLRVEAVVLVLVNDRNATDFNRLTSLAKIEGYHQAINIPKNAGKPVQYAGSTTGPSYNKKSSPFQVSWSVRPRVIKVNAETVGQWCNGNIFAENHAHGVRNLVTIQKLLSKIK